VMLQLQRVAGNAAVSRLLARQATPYKELKQAFEAALAKPDYAEAVKLLNGFQESDIRRFLADLPYEKELELQKHADPYPGTKALLDAEIKRVDDWRELVRAYDAAKAVPDHTKMALILNGMSEQAMLERLRDLPLDEVKKVRDAAEAAMKGWPDRVPKACRQVIMAAPVPPGSPAPREKGSGDASEITEEKLKKVDNRASWEKFRDTRDQKAREFGAADYADYVQNMLLQGGSIVGLKARAANPLHPLFMDRLEAGSQKAETIMGNTDFGINSISGQENRPGNHAWGLASDFDANANPYVINERGEEEHDKLLEEVYQRIAKALLDRDTVLTRSVEPSGKDKGTPTKLSGASYDAIAEEADAMAAYFSVLDDPESEADKKRAKLPTRRRLTTKEFPKDKLEKLDKAQVQADYDLLLTKKGAGAVKGDPVFTGGGPGSYRDPRRGFMSIRKEIVEGMQAAGLRWGGSDFGAAECGDIMHFDDGNRHADYVAYGKANPTERRKAEG
jgi:hypothetical protein